MLETYTKKFRVPAHWSNPLHKFASGLCVLGFLFCVIMGSLSLSDPVQISTPNVVLNANGSLTSSPGSYVNWGYMAAASVSGASGSSTSNLAYVNDTQPFGFFSWQSLFIATFGLSFFCFFSMLYHHQVMRHGAFRSNTKWFLFSFAACGWFLILFSAAWYTARAGNNLPANPAGGSLQYSWSWGQNVWWAVFAVATCMLAYMLCIPADDEERTASSSRRRHHSGRHTSSSNRRHNIIARQPTRHTSSSRTPSSTRRRYAPQMAGHREGTDIVFHNPANNAKV